MDDAPSAVAREDLNGDGPRFAVDAMLGRLARWLRVLGYDTWYHESVEDPLLVRLADEEERVLLTRDRHLLRELRPARALEVRQDDPLLQLQQVVDALALEPPSELFTRCLLCNAPLLVLPDDEAQALLPPGVRGIAGGVRQCPVCGRVYWGGSHVRRMRAALERVLPGWGGFSG